MGEINKMIRSQQWETDIENIVRYIKECESNNGELSSIRTTLYVNFDGKHGYEKLFDSPKSQSTHEMLITVLQSFIRQRDLLLKECEAAKELLELVIDEFRNRSMGNATSHMRV